nr:unnamed protein product [Spirometra erinaceieuropaei]
MLLAENPNLITLMYPYSTSFGPHASETTDSALSHTAPPQQVPPPVTATLIYAQPTSPLALPQRSGVTHFTQHLYNTPQKSTTPRSFLATNGSPDLMSVSMQASSNTFQGWPPPVNANNNSNGSSNNSGSRFPQPPRRGPSSLAAQPVGLKTDFSSAIAPPQPSHLFRPHPHLAGVNPCPGAPNANLNGVDTTSFAHIDPSKGYGWRRSQSTNWKERPHVGKYSLIRTIGKGNFAKVKLAQHVTTGMEVRCCLYLLAPGDL